MVVRIKMEQPHGPYSDDREPAFSRYEEIRTAEGAHQATSATMEIPQAFPQGAWPEIHLHSAGKKSPVMRTEPYPGWRGGETDHFFPQNITTEIAGVTVCEVMNALLEHPETFGYLASATHAIREDGELANGTSAKDHIKNADRRIARFNKERAWTCPGIRGG